MSQVGNVLRMLVLLKGNGMMKIKELAQIIGVDERTIRRYKDDLEQARIYVNSKAGRFGGYYLDDEDYLLSLNVTAEEYISLNSGLSERVVRPYDIYQYKGDMYFAAYCEQRGKILDFKLSRIKSYAVIDERFEADNSFNLKSSMRNCIGIYKDDEYRVKLKISFPMSHIVKEKIWVEDQKITEFEDSSIIYEAKMRGFTEIKNWVLSMGSQAIVMEPKELRNELVGELDKIRENYQRANI